MPITIHTRQTKANGAASAWRTNYPFEKHDILGKLVALGPTPDPDAVDRIIGNSSWTDVPSCDNCGTRSSAAATCGEPPERESSTATLCLDCLNLARDRVTWALREGGLNV